MERSKCRFCGKPIGRNAQAALWVSSGSRPAECDRGGCSGYHVPGG
jgi:hypothetical protein